MDHGHYVGDRYIPKEVLQKIEDGEAPLVASRFKHNYVDQVGSVWTTMCSREKDGSQLWDVESKLRGSPIVTSSHTISTKPQPDGSQSIFQQHHESYRTDGTEWTVNEDGEGLVEAFESSTPVGELEFIRELTTHPDSGKVSFPVGESGWEGTMYKIEDVDATMLGDGGRLKRASDGITVEWTRKETDVGSVIEGTLHHCGTPSGATDTCCSDGISIDLSKEVQYDEELHYIVPKEILDLVGLSN